MNARKTAGIVAAGYALAALAGFSVMIVEDFVVRRTGPDGQGGMAAFGELMLGFFVFCVLSLVPTGILLHALRRFERFWIVLGNACIAIATTAVLAAALYAAQGMGMRGGVVDLSIFRVFLSPGFAATFAVASIVAPSRETRARLVVAAMIEGAVLAVAVAFAARTIYMNSH